jgi:hypothetical protein
MTMKRWKVIWLTGVVLTALTILVIRARGEKQGSAVMNIAPETVADYLHAVIASDRTFYTVQVVERLQLKGAIVAAHNWRRTKTLPLPAQFLQETSQLAALTGSKVRYRLISPWPINPLNRPTTAYEQTGLQTVLQNPDTRYSEVVMDGEETYFHAIYADLAVAQACIGCHNAHPNTPKRDFKLHDVMGAVVISFPVEPNR